MLNKSTVPKSIGLIMDGNGRWAEEKGLPRKEGHTEGIANMLRLACKAFELGVNNFVCYSLSTENLGREKDEIDHILNLVIQYEDVFVGLCKKYQVAVKYVGRLELLPPDVLESLKRNEDTLSEFLPMGRVMYIAIAYGGRAEITDAVNRAIKSGTAVTESSFLELLDLPAELDLVIRTGGERRLSNFFLYQASYAELYFSDKYFPDFSEDDLCEALSWFLSRKRRYGLVK